MDVAGSDRGLAEKYLGMILAQTERAVPTGTPRSQNIVNMGTTKGTIAGELMRSALQYKSFTLSFMTNQLQGMQMAAQGSTWPKVAGAAYAGSVMIPLTLAGAAALQIKNIINGRDVQDMSASSPAFWMSAMQYGGGLGVMGDFLFSDVSRFGQSPLETLEGPLAGLATDISKPILSNAQRRLKGEKTSAVRDATNLAGRYTPLLSSLPYTRMAYRRMVLDQLQYLADSDAHTHFRNQEQSLHRETGQSYFWRPGQAIPNRGPELAPPKR
jgi:hypothetical protein